MIPPTRSGLGTVSRLTDEEALALVAGDVLFIETPRGLASVVVERTRAGVAYDAAEHPYEVPVVVLASGLVYAPSDLYLCRELARAVVALAAVPLDQFERFEGSPGGTDA